MTSDSPQLSASDTTSALSSYDRRKLLDLQRSRLTIIRKKAANWGKGVGGLLAAVLGFGLIKGPSDISVLQAFWSVSVGIVVAAALVTGIVAALNLLRAAFGTTRATEMPDGDIGRAYAQETDDSERALNRGLIFGGVSLTLIVIGVGITWYAPHKGPPLLMLTMHSGIVVCGQPEGVTGGTIDLKTSTGKATINLNEAAGVQPVESCPKS